MSKREGLASGTNLTTTMLLVTDYATTGPAAALARESLAFEALEHGATTESLLFWESRQTAVVLGAFGRSDREVHVEKCGADDVPVLRRISGGGAVVVARGCLNYALVLSLDDRPELGGVARSYELILGRLVKALGVPGLEALGASDLALREKKVAGSAQKRGRRTLLHHGTLLYDFDVAALATYLREPPRQPTYRAGRRHQAFITNLPLAPGAIKGRLARAWAA